MANWCDNYIIVDKGLTEKQFDDVKNIVKNREENHKDGDTIFIINDMELKDGMAQ